MPEQVTYKVLQVENVGAAETQMNNAANEGFRFVAFAPDARANRLYIVMEKRVQNP